MGGRAGAHYWGNTMTWRKRARTLGAGMTACAVAALTFMNTAPDAVAAALPSLQASVEAQAGAAGAAGTAGTGVLDPTAGLDTIEARHPTAARKGASGTATRRHLGHPPPGRPGTPAPGSAAG